MNKKQLFDQIVKKRSYLCVGLDTDIEKLPRHLLQYDDPVYEFNRKIIEATSEYCVSYKPNMAFYESLGAKGWDSLSKSIDVIPGDIFTIADAKRGDIGNTSRLYAKAFFEHMNFDAITISPYMGKDSIIPYLEFDSKWVIVLAHTSNEGSNDFQLLVDELSGDFLFASVIKKCKQWAAPDQLMFVVGATHANRMAEIRSLAPDNFFLVPGIGAQGGDLDLISKYGLNDQCGLLVNSSRSIIYASDKEDFAEAARREAKKIQLEMASLLDKYLG